MNHTSVIGLINNAALLLALCLLYDMLGFKLQERKTIIQQILTGIVLGTIGLAIMFNSWNFGQGVVFDTRSVLLVISGFFFGSIPVAIAVLMTAAFRFISGGAGVWTGLAVIVTSGVIGLLWRHYRPHKNQKPSITELYLLGIVVHVVMLGCFFLLPWKFALEVLAKISLPVMFIYPIATAILGNLMVMSEKRRQYEKNLRESEERYRELVENANSIILRMDSKGQVSFFNEFAQNFFGYEAHEIIGRSVVGTIVPATDSAGRDLLSMITDIGLQPQLYITNENENIRRDGTRIWIAWTNKPIYDATGKVSEILCIGNDITERKQIEKELQKKNEELDRFFSLSLDLLCIADTNGEFIRLNPEWEKILGYSEAELKGRSFLDFVHPEDIDATIMALTQLDDQHEVLNFENRFRCNDGSYRWIEWRSKPQGNLIYAAARDITERKLSEGKLKESEERFKSLHNASFGGITIHDKGLILECNQGLSEITGYSVEELIGMDGLLLIAPSSRELVMNHIATGYEKPYEALGLRKDGEEYPLRLEARVIPYKGKNVRVVEFRNISEYKQFEAEREKLHGQLIQAQKMESVGRLAGGVAHDFNNMLGVILGRTELALENLDPSQPQYADLEEIRKAAERSANLTRQLLAFARKQTIAPKILDLNDAVSSMINMVQRLIGEDIDLVWLPKINLWPVKMDPSQLDQILANICVNARDAISGIGKVTIETENITFGHAYCANHPGYIPGEYVQLALSDNGCGMDKETLTHIYEPFFTTKDMGKGTGLGLAMVYGIVKQNNGFINVYSEPGQGSTFKIYLPRYKDLITPVPENEPAQPAARGQETILLVEDESAILAMTTAMLQRLGYTVLPANTPGEAIRQAESHKGKISLLLTDVVMPEMNGRDLAKRLMELNPGLKPLFMSGYTANVIAHHGVLDQGVKFIEKPFTKKDLADKIREVLS